jgi:hypothetical protein
MRNVTTATVLLFLVGCSDQMYETYSTYAEAQRAGAIERGGFQLSFPEALAISPTRTTSTPIGRRFNSRYLLLR